MRFLSIVLLASFGLAQAPTVALCQPGGPPNPPILEAVDTNKDGEISAQELQKAPAAIKSLDRNKDGEITGDELFPAGFGPGGPGGGPGGPGGFNRGGNGGGNNSAIPPEELDPADGAASIDSHEMYHRMSYKGEEVMIDTFLADLEFVKFTLNNASTDKPTLYFINTKRHRAHPMFARVAGLPSRGGDVMKGVLVYRPMLKSPSGTPGLYTFEFEPFDRFTYQQVKKCQDVLVSKMPALKGKIGYYPRGTAIQVYEQEKDLYRAENSAVKIYLDEDLVNTEIGYLPLNLAETYGRLREMKINERPSPRDVVIYHTLPNEMPRTAGIITAVRQTPLSNVNLRAIQDQVPNAFVADVATDPQIKSLLGKFVYYKVTIDGYEIREASQKEVDAHFAKIRPREPQIPARDLTVKTIKDLDELGFKDSSSVGVKAANIATLRSFGLPEETVPDGFAIPFYFYDEFMKHNEFYQYAERLTSNPGFKRNHDVQVQELKEFRSLIRKAPMPEWMLDELDQLHKKFPKGTSLRCRSSTNNEDLPGFSGAGLYGSYTHKKSEGHLAKSIKQVFASLWNFRAYEEREFYRVDHLKAAMGVLVHPNYKGELANGVAVTDDILYQTTGNYYVNTQVGEDLVTNPDEESVPEEMLLDWWKADFDRVVRTSNRVAADKQLLSAEHIEQLRKHLATIHAKFAKLYGKSLDANDFAMEIEFKITKEGKLAIKQARPWVYSSPKQAAGNALAQIPSNRGQGNNGGGFGPGGPGGGPGGFNPGGRGPGGPGGRGPGGPGRGRDIAIMSAPDTNRDGRISADEIKAASVSLAKLDKNKDGKLSKEEIGWPPAGGFDRGGREPGGRDPRDGRGDRGPGGTGFFSPDRMKVLDKNKDGKISKNEIPSSLRNFILSRLDRDMNGLIDENEIRQANQPRRDQRQPR